MKDNIDAIKLSDEDKRLFRLGSGNDHPAMLFPRVEGDPLASSSLRKAWLFQLTGYTAKPLDYRGWRLLNESLNRGLDLGLNNHELNLLSLIDEMLGEVPRLVGMRHVAPQKTDSTAAHTKQVMNLVQQVWESAGIVGTPSMKQLRLDALLGTWLHDMGEVVLELATATQVFAMPKEQQAEFKEQKDIVERDVFKFSLDLAEKALKDNDPAQFARVIKELRAELIAVPKGNNQIWERMDLLKRRIAELRAELELPDTRSETAEKLLHLYDRIEEPEKNDFLHPFVKTIESVEGQRYLQRNGADAAHMALYRSLNPDAMASDLGMHLISDHEIISACRRCEKRLPMLFERAQSPEQKKLARAAAQFTYRSLGRQFLPKKEDHVEERPQIIDRQPSIRSHDDASLSVQELETIRAQENDYKSAQLSSQNNDDYDQRYYSSERAGRLFQAAHDAIGKKTFIPKVPSLIALDDSPSLPPSIISGMKQLESGRNVTDFKGRG